MEASAEAVAEVSVRCDGLDQVVDVDSWERFLDGESDGLGFARVLHSWQQRIKNNEGLRGGHLADWRADSPTEWTLCSSLAVHGIHMCFLAKLDITKCPIPWWILETISLKIVTSKTWMICLAL